MEKVTDSNERMQKEEEAHMPSTNLDAFVMIMLWLINWIVWLNNDERQCCNLFHVCLMYEEVFNSFDDASKLLNEIVACRRGHFLDIMVLY